MLKIYANSLSQPCNKVRYACHLLKIDYEWIVMDFASGDMKKPEYLALLHPAGKVPVIDDAGFILFESEAITRYLVNEVGGSSLHPSDPRERATVDQWSCFSTQHVGPAMGKVVFNRLVAPMFGLEVDERSLSEGLDWLENRFLPIVDAQLSKNKHLAGADLTLADLSLLSVLDPAERVDVDLAAFKNLTEWRARLQAQDFWKKAQE